MALDPAPKRTVQIVAFLAFAALVAAVALTGSSSSSKNPPAGVVTSTLPPSTTSTTLSTPPATSPPASPAPPATAAAATSSYTVRPGDTLSAIAAAHGLDWPALCAANHLADCNSILPGQVLTLGGAPGPSAPANGSSVQAKPKAAPVAKATPKATSAAAASTRGCAAAFAYLASHAAPGFTFTCAPGASESLCKSPSSGPNRAVGCTVATSTGDGPVTGQIAIDSGCAVFVAYANEASNSRKFAHLTDAPVDPYGRARC